MLHTFLWTGLYAALGAAATTASQGGVKAELSDEPADDAAFLRKLKVKRTRGEAPADEKLGEPPKPRRRKGPSPWLVLGGAIVGGYFIAKVVDWRGHAHPRD